MTNFNIARFFTRKNLFEAGIKNNINRQLQQSCSNLKNSYFEASKVNPHSSSKNKNLSTNFTNKSMFQVSYKCNQRSYKLGSRFK